jgi:hypothetical protein
MRTPFRWALQSQASLHILCACCVFSGTPAAALATPGQMTPAPVVSGPASGALSERRVVLLLAIGSVVAVGCVVGMIGGRTSRSPREPRLRLINKPKRTNLSVLVPPGPAPRLIPSDSPNAARKRPAHSPVPRQTPDGTTRSGIVDYLAAFADASKASERERVDYLLVSGDDSVEQSCGNENIHRERSDG